MCQIDDVLEEVAEGAFGHVRPDGGRGDIEPVPPGLTFTDRLALHVGDVRAELPHLGPVYTGSDTVVRLPGQRVLFADDAEEHLRYVRRLAREGVEAGLAPVGIPRRADLGPYGGRLDPEYLVPDPHRATAEERGAAPGSPVGMTALFGEMIEFHDGIPACHA
ncbi:hypothetical protein [Streptomyces sp. NPDC002537]